MCMCVCVSVQARVCTVFMSDRGGPVGAAPLGKLPVWGTLLDPR